MPRLRSLVDARRWLTLVIMVAVLAVRIAVPAGMMPGHGAGGPTLSICSGMPAMSAGKAGTDRHDAGKPEAPCAFTGLFAAALDAAAWPDLAPPPVAAIALRLSALVPVTVATLRLWPQRRGPPAPFA